MDIPLPTMAGDLRTLMRRFVNRLDQTEFVRLLNQQFSEVSRDGVFATAIVTTFFAPSRRLMVCNAGHPRPLLYRRRNEEVGLAWAITGGGRFHASQLAAGDHSDDRVRAV